MDFLDKLGIDWRLFLAQLFNFAVLLFILFWFLYRPVVRILEERRSRVMQNIKREGELDQLLKDADQLLIKRAKEAEEKAVQILQEAENKARQHLEAGREVAAKEVERLINDARRQAADERREALKEVRAESIRLVREALKNILKASSSEAEYARLYEKAAEKVKQV